METMRSASKEEMDMQGRGGNRGRPRVLGIAWGVAALAALGLWLVPAGGGLAQGTKEGYLGVNLQDLDDELRTSYGLPGRDGVLVTSVAAESPAEKAGIQRGDVVLRVAGQAVTSASEVTGRVRAMAPGETAVIALWREGREVTVRARLGERPSRAPRAPRAPSGDDEDDEDRVFLYGWGDEGELDLEDLPKPEDFERLHGLNVLVGGRGRLGVRTQSVDGQLGEYFQAPGGKGVLVTEVIEDTPAAKAGLATGDLILSVEGKSVSTSLELRNELAKRDEGPVRLEVLRRGARQSLTAQLEKPDEVRYFSHRAPSRVYRYRVPRVERHWGPQERREFDREMDRLRREMRELEREMDELRRELRED
jgi:membrane-associated protease RseP (regulator of RpoE activity)